ncbi:hypothetical protein MYAM1_003117 [Malassezia yamatoensis]|uniref:Small ribosomal subunit protein mS29 n=1 Tax=Malassezia yamatoensis TaxID=253288 RepID=A0AAJ5YTD0_9BASI|nr:hypothetical protein MYAM1_003117 [Malassezia yamatoensis]
MSDLLELDASAISKSTLATPLAWTKMQLEAQSRFGLPQEIKRSQTIQPRPRTIIRSKSVSLIDSLESANKSASQRQLLIGELGCGKSTYILQSIAHALSAGWIVLYIPRAISLVDSSSPYAYNAALQTYLQPAIVDHLLSAMLDVNRKALKQVKINEALRVDNKEVFASGTTLDAVLDRTLKEHNSAFTRQLVLELVWSTLAKQSEVPVLVAVDDAQVLFGPTLYRNPDFVPLQAYELAVPRSLLNIFISPRENAHLKRGAVLATISMTHANFPAPAELLIAMRESASAEKSSVPWNRVKKIFASPTCPTRVSEPHAYTEIESQNLTNARNAQFQLVDVGEKLSRPEAASLLHLMSRENAFWAIPDDELFIEKLVESSGNIRSFEQNWRKSLM